MHIQRTTRPAGELAITPLRPPGVIPVTDPKLLLKLAAPQVGLADEVNEWRTKNLDHYLDGWQRVQTALRSGLSVLIGSLYLRRLCDDGRVLDLGLAGHQVMTTAAANKFVDALRTADATTIQNFKYHGIGTGTNAEAVTDTTLQTEVGSSYATAGTRPAGSQILGSNNNIYRTVGIVTVGTLGASLSITEHGVFSAAAVGSGTLLDRTVFAGAPVTLNSNEAAQGTYDLTIAAGG